MFNYKSQKQFYTDYAIKEGQIPTEGNINLFGVRLKKELTDLYNRFQIQVGNKPLDWVRIETYEINEIVNYNDKSYMCLQENAGKEPDQNKEFWRPINSTDISKFTFENYLAKDNQTPYEPKDMKDTEEKNDYHPTTVKHVEERIDYWHQNVPVEDSNNLGGQPPEYYASGDSLKEFAKTVLTVNNIVDNLITDENTSTLSSRQGKVLKEMIDKINDVLTVNDMTLNELQEIVNYIKQNRDIINNGGGVYATLNKSSAPTKDNSFDLGSTTSKFANIYANNFIGNFMQAKLADVAEVYETKKQYEGTTVLGISNKGITEYTPKTKYFGVVSMFPAILLNREAKGVPVVLKGRVPVRIQGSAEIGDYIYAHDKGYGIASKDFQADKQDKLIGICLKSGSNVVEVKI